MQSNYWTERAIREKKKALRIAASGNKRMQKQLKATASQINNDIQLFYKKYAQDAGISIAAAKTYLTNKEAGLSYQEYLGLVTEALRGSEHADALLNANLAKQRITRLDALCRQITGRLAVLGGKLENEIGSALLEVGTFEALPYKTLEKLLITDGRWSKRVWGHVGKLDETINKALRDGIAAGASSDVIAKRVQARTGVAMSRCRTLVHTECCYVTESATLDRYIAADVKQYGYLATLDKKTCSGFGGHSCGALDGQVFDVRDAQVGVNYPPMHPNCRCTTYAVFDDGSDEEADFYRVARDENGKNYHVSAKTTYREWKKNNHKNLAKAIDSMYTISESGRETYTKQEIIDEMSKSEIGQQVLSWIEKSNVSIAIREDEYGGGNRGDQRGRTINLYPRNIKSVRVVAQTLIHEMGHYYYDIGYCQHAEAICFGLEKLHLTGKEKLTRSEWEYVKKLAIDNYPEYNWEAGGYGDYTKIHIVDD